MEFGWLWLVPTAVRNSTIETAGGFCSSILLNNLSAVSLCCCADFLNSECHTTTQTQRNKSHSKTRADLGADQSLFESSIRFSLKEVVNQSMKRSFTVWGFAAFLIVLIALTMSSSSAALSPPPPASTDWEHLVGKAGVEAQDFIQQARPDVKIFIVKEGTPVTMDFNPTRVRIFVDADNKVVQRPQLA